MVSGAPARPRVVFVCVPYPPNLSAGRQCPRGRDPSEAPPKCPTSPRPSRQSFAACFARARASCLHAPLPRALRCVRAGPEAKEIAKVQCCCDPPACHHSSPCVASQHLARRAGSSKALARLNPKHSAPSAAHRRAHRAWSHFGIRFGRSVRAAPPHRHTATPPRPSLWHRPCAQVIPYFPFKGIPRFYDIGGFLKHPEGALRRAHVTPARARSAAAAGPGPRIRVCRARALSLSLSRVAVGGVGGVGGCEGAR